jgi:hypothetical protein
VNNSRRQANNTLRPFWMRWCIAGFGVWALSLGLSPAAVGQIAIRGETVYTMAGPPVKNGVVVVEGGKIVAVGPADQIVVPPNAEVLEAKVVTPGLIDAHATAGLTGILNQSQDQDQLDSSEAIQPELRALDAINIHEELVGYLRGFGVTTLHTGHASRELISGQTLIVKTVGQTVEQALVKETAAVVATLGPAARRNQGSPGTRGKQMAMLRQELIKAGEYAEKVRRAEQQAAEDGDTGQGRYRPGRYRPGQRGAGAKPEKTVPHRLRLPAICDWRLCPKCSTARSRYWSRPTRPRTLPRPCDWPMSSGFGFGWTAPRRLICWSRKSSGLKFRCCCTRP